MDPDPQSVDRSGSNGPRPSAGRAGGPADETLPAPGHTLAFGPFCLDPPNARLTRGRQAVALRPKVLDVLAYLLRRAGRLVTQDELLQAVWPDTVVGDASLKSCIRQIRRALGDHARRPQFIETVHRRGYRFIAV